MTGGPKRILVVDPDHKSRRILEVTLRKAGHEVIGASAAREALDVLERLPVHLMVIETALPDATGFELCRHVKTLPDQEGLPFVFLSQSRDVADRMRGFELGVEDYIGKPVYVKEIVARVGILLSRRDKDLVAEAEAHTVDGALADVSLVDLFQAIEDGAKTGALRVESHHRRGLLHFAQGSPLDARAGVLEGEAAVYRLLRWTDGHFTIKYVPQVRRSRRISASFSELIVDGLQAVEQFEGRSAELAPFDLVFRVDYRKLSRAGELPEATVEVLQLFDGRRPLGRVIDDSPLADLETVDVVRKLADAALLEELGAASELAESSLEDAPAEPFGRIGSSWMWRETTEARAGREAEERRRQDEERRLRAELDALRALREEAERKVESAEQGMRALTAEREALQSRERQLAERLATPPQARTTADFPALETPSPSPPKRLQPNLEPAPARDGVDAALEWLERDSESGPPSVSAQFTRAETAPRRIATDPRFRGDMVGETARVELETLKRSVDEERRRLDEMQREAEAERLRAQAVQQELEERRQAEELRWLQAEQERLEAERQQLVSQRTRLQVQLQSEREQLERERRRLQAAAGVLPAPLAGLEQPTPLKPLPAAEPQVSEEPERETAPTAVAAVGVEVAKAEAAPDDADSERRLRTVEEARRRLLAAARGETGAEKATTEAPERASEPTPASPAVTMVAPRRPDMSRAGRPAPTRSAGSGPPPIPAGVPVREPGKALEAADATTLLRAEPDQPFVSGAVVPVTERETPQGGLASVDLARTAADGSEGALEDEFNKFFHSTNEQDYFGAMGASEPNRRLRTAILFGAPIALAVIAIVLLVTLDGEAPVAPVQPPAVPAGPTPEELAAMERDAVARAEALAPETLALARWAGSTHQALRAAREAAGHIIGWAGGPVSPNGLPAAVAADAVAPAIPGAELAVLATETAQRAEEPAVAPVAAVEAPPTQPEREADAAPDPEREEEPARERRRDDEAESDQRPRERRSREDRAEEPAQEARTARRTPASEAEDEDEDAYDPQTGLQRARDLMAEGVYGEAAAELRLVVQAQPGNRRAHQYLGECLLNLDEAQEAVPHLEQATEVARPDDDALLLLGSAQSDAGAHSAADETYRRYLELYPDGQYASDVRAILEQ